MSNNNVEEIAEEQEFDIKYWFFRTLSYWYVFVIAIGLFLSGAYIYLRYTKKTYSSSASILIKSDSQNSDLNMNLLGGLGGFGRGGYSITEADIEIEMIKSFDVIQKTLDSLNFQSSYFAEGNVKTKELYKDSPIIVKTIGESSNGRFYIHLNGTESFSHTSSKEASKDQLKPCKYGEPCNIGSKSYIVEIADSSIASRYKLPILVRTHNLTNLTVQYIGKVNAQPRSQNARFAQSAIIDLSIQGYVMDKNIDFLNTLCSIYIGDRLNEKNQVATNTIKFIDDQLQSIADSLSWVEDALERYRTNKGIVDLSSKGNIALERLTDVENQKELLALNRKYYDYLAKYLQDAQDSIGMVIAPASVGVEDPTLTALILELNQLLSKRVNVELTAGENSFLLQNLNEQISSVKSRLRENVRNILANNSLSIEQIDQRILAMKGEISRLPKSERELLNIRRKFDLNNELYTFLLKKKSESEITKAATTPNVSIVNIARDIQSRVTGPFAKRIYITSAVVAFFIVLTILVVKFYLSNTITDLYQIKKYESTPILASIPHSSSESGVLVVDSPKSSFAEAFRNIRINLDFILPHKESKVIGITSTISGEGKTFCAINLAHIIALADKKTLLIGLDLRKPKLHSELGLTKDKGLSSYLIGAASFEESLQKSTLDSLDIMTSGPLPPNPTELIENGRLEELLEEAKEKYDYIIVDGPPIGLVTDYIAAAQLMQTTLFIVRLNYSKIHSVDILNNYHAKGILKSAYTIVNDITFNSRAYEYSYSYTYGYGYGYGHTYGAYGSGYTEDTPPQKPFWKRIFGA